MWKTALQAVAEKTEMQTEFPRISDSQLRATLQEALHQPAGMISVHAAESLLLLGDRDDVLARFQSERDGPASAYQVAVWRVLARAEISAAAREEAIAKIRRTLLEETSAFRPHAMESLAKLQAPILPEELPLVESSAHSPTDAAAPLALWRLAQTESRVAAISGLTDCLSSGDDLCRLRGAYVLWHLKDFPQQTLLKLREGVTEPAFPALTRLVFALACGHEMAWDLTQEAGVPVGRYFLVLELADRTDAHSRQILEQLAGDQDLDVRAAAAFGLLQRQKLK
ncbi:hypothetical protein SH661x_002461 [Planctomicrobium sp. SH661]|uniref:hypothetical protein n=1 Tax=Planctomicrobium sp. SH661 TaxID=3448124 RepID=UPI003F5B97FC